MTECRYCGNETNCDYNVCGECEQIMDEEIDVENTVEADSI